MDTTKDKDKLPDQPQDLAKTQRPEETDNIAKAEHPADDFMDSRRMDRETHGKKKES